MSEELISSGLHGDQYGICVTPDGQSLFLCGHTVVLRVDIASRNVDILPPKPLYPTGLKVSRERSTVIWGDSQAGKIYECSFDGKTIRALPGVFSGVSAVAIDNTREQVYWIDYRSSEILAAKFDGTARRTISKINVTGEKSLVFDSPQDVLYWSGRGILGIVPLSGRESEVLVVPGIESSDSIDLFSPIVASPKQDSPGSDNAHATSQIDGLTQIDIQRDAFKGKWRFQGDTLIGETQAKIAVPVKLPQDYNVDIDFIRRSGNDSFVVMIPVGRSQANVMLSGDFGQYHGLANIDGKHPSAPNPTTLRPGRIENGRKLSLKIQVRAAEPSARVMATLEDQVIFSWEGKTQSLSVPADWHPPDRSVIGLATTNCQIEVHSLKVHFERAEPAKVVP